MNRNRLLIGTLQVSSTLFANNETDLTPSQEWRINNNQYKINNNKKKLDPILDWKLWSILFYEIRPIFNDQSPFGNINSTELLAAHFGLKVALYTFRWRGTQKSKSESVQFPYWLI